MKPLLLVIFSLVTSGVTHAQKQQAFTVYFDVDQDAITSTAAKTLDSFLAAHNSRTTIELFGYCDSSAGFAYNDALSLKRVNAVKDHLLNKGFDTANITAEKWYGKRKPLNSNTTQQERSLNRRVEIVFYDTPIVVTGLKRQLPTKTLTEQLKHTLSVAGKNIILQNLNFYGGTHRVLPESLPVLQELLAVMKSNPSLEIAIEGHICCTEGPGDGRDIETSTDNLSENRAKEIFNYLQRNGIAANRLQYRGMGHRFPLTASVETTEEERTANRRVEIQIIKR